MTKAAYDKIAEGLEEALAVAKGEVGARLSVSGAPSWATHLLVKARLQSGEEVELRAPVDEEVSIPVGAEVLAWAFDGPPLPESAFITLVADPDDVEDTPQDVPEIVEGVARIICEHRGIDPDTAYNDVEPAWWAYRDEAEEIIDYLVGRLN